MAAKKKVKRKAKTKKKAPARKPAARKKVVKKKTKVAPRKAARKPVTRRVAPKKKPPVKKPAKAPKAPAAPAGPQPLPNEERVGIVTHYYTHLSVAVVRIESGALRAGDTIHIKGHTSDFTQKVESMEVDRVHVDEARAGQSFGLRVNEHAREHDVVFRVKTP